MKLHQNNSSVNQTRLPLLCEIWSHTPILRQAAGRQSDKILVDLLQIVRIFMVFNKVQCYYSDTNAVFSGKVYCEECYRGM